MLLDAKFQFSGALSSGVWTGQGLTGTSAVDSTNTIDLGAVVNGQNTKYGPGYQPLYIVVSAQLASGGTTPGLKVDVVTADDSAFSTNSQVVGSFTVGALKAGDLAIIPFPQTNRRFVKLVYTQTGTTPTNNVVASLTTHPQQWESTADFLTSAP